MASVWYMIFFQTLALEQHMQKGHYENKDQCIRMVDRGSNVIWMPSQH